VLVASTAGFGQKVDWTWDAAGETPGDYSYAIRAGDDVTPATGRIGGGSDAELALTGVAADPETVSPNDDGAADASTITYTLSDAANVTVTVRNANGETVLALPKTWRRALEHAVRIDPAGLPDGLYSVVLEAVATRGRTATASLPLAVTRTLGSFDATRDVFSPNADRRADTIGFRFALAAPAEVKLRVLREGKWVATPLAGPLQAGAQRIDWNGAKRIGKLRDGDYEAVLEVTDAVATSRLALPFSSDTTRPRLRILSRSPLRVWASEPATLTVRSPAGSLRRVVRRPGEVKIWGAGRSGLVRIVAWDAAGNASVPVSRR
jgi:hypothetical protein